MAALFAGLVFCLSLLWLKQSSLDISWPFFDPLIFLQLALFYPLTEEILFRGWLQSVFARYPIGCKRWGPISVANLLTSVVFAVFHLYYHSYLWSLLVIVPSLVFGYFREKFSGLHPPIILHIFYNTSYFWLFKP